MRHFAITGIVTASWISLTIAGSDMRATPPCARMSAGTRSSAITAQAPASSAILAWSALVTSMITPPLSISARPVLTRKVARSAIAPHSRREGCLPECWAGNLACASPIEGSARRGEGIHKVWGPSPGPRDQLQVRIAPRACGLAIKRALLQLEGADPVAMSRLVTGVDPVRERLDQAHQRRVGADVGRAVRAVVEHQLRVLGHVRERRVGDRHGPRSAVAGELQGPQDERMRAPCGQHDQQRVLVHPRKLLDVVLARRGDD